MTGVSVLSECVRAHRSRRRVKTRVCSRVSENPFLARPVITPCRAMAKGGKKKEGGDDGESGPRVTAISAVVPEPPGKEVSHPRLPFHGRPVRGKDRASTAKFAPTHLLPPSLSQPDRASARTSRRSSTTSRAPPSPASSPARTRRSTSGTTPRAARRSSPTSPPTPSPPPASRR